MNDIEGNTPMIFITGSVTEVEDAGWFTFLTLSHKKSIPHITGLQSSPNSTTF
jgi:hypothetical protein